MSKPSTARGNVRITIRDVALHAAVNPSTVSRALNPSTRHLIGDEVVRRVMASAKALGYRQNKLAAALRGGQSHVIGVCLPDIENPVFPPIVRGIEEQMSAAGYGVLIANVAGPAKEQEKLLEQMLERRVDGLILATAVRQDPLVRKTLLQRIPVVLVNRAWEAGQVPEVVNDDLLSLQLAVDHLVALGHKQIAHLAGPSHLATGHTRVVGFEIAMKRHGLDPAVIVETSEFTREAGRQACETLLREHKGVTAIVAANDLIALGCYDTFADAGIRCPADISLVGHNDMPLFDMLSPPLTTIRIQHREMGRHAAQLLLNVINTPDSPPLRITLPPQLILRGSTDVPRKVKSGAQHRTTQR